MRTLRSKLLVFFVAITSIPLLVIGFVSYETQESDLSNRIEQTLISFSANLSVSVEGMIQERLSDLEQLATSPVIRDPQASEEELQAEFTRFIESQEMYHGMVFTDNEGTIAHSTEDNAVGRNVNDLDWYEEAKNGELYFSDLFMSKVLERPILAMSAGVKDEEGNNIGVISPAYDLVSLETFIWDRMNRFTDEQEQLGMNGEAFILNEEGYYIAHPDSGYILDRNFIRDAELSTEEFQELGNSPSLTTNRSEETVTTIVPIEQMEGFDNQWYVGISVPESALYAPLRRLLLTYVILFSAVLIITILAAVALSRYIVRPLELLVTATRDFAVGKPVMPLPSASYSEVNELTQTFNVMTARLEEREKSHKKSTLILETTDNGVISINKSTYAVTTFNYAASSLFQLNKNNVLASSLDDLKNQSSLFRAFIEKVDLELEKEETNEMELTFEGKTYYFITSVTLLPRLEDAEQVEDILIVFNDVTDNRALEKELIRSEKLQAVGKLASGFAHEIRNPLTTIKGFIQLFKETSEQKEEEVQHYQIILSEIDRVNGIVRDLLGIASPEYDEKAVQVNMNTILQDIVYLHKDQALAKNIEIHTPWQEIPDIYANEKKLKQLYLNLLQNAMEAVKENGRISIRTYEFFNEAGRSCIGVEIEDTGDGMDTRTLSKLGTPFFTTKDEGTGLGLMICYQIVSEMDGKIKVFSAEGKGTLFQLTFPTE
ncbi:PAS domain-containing sensor histidine kinase [Sinobaca sp. H24]|uniref:PAS domain-containing sensor histidine kinase n=1 Tax=Sinobaca sp. H24 TaxID=2923376 RepID=UPI00207AF150|nr:PAS domain-containing sensor histidine kinase [Sinobaca sp. H24]